MNCADTAVLLEDGQTRQAASVWPRCVLGRLQAGRALQTGLATRHGQLLLLLNSLPSLSLSVHQAKSLSANVVRVWLSYLDVWVVGGGGKCVCMCVCVCGGGGVL